MMKRSVSWPPLPLTTSWPKLKPPFALARPAFSLKTNRSSPLPPSMRVVAGTIGDQGIATVSADQRIDAGRIGLEHVDAGAALERGVAGACEDQVVARTAVNRDVAGACKDDVVAGAAIDRVIAVQRRIGRVRPASRR